MTEITIDSEGWSLDIDLVGGRIKQLKYGDDIVLGTYKRGDGKIANTHLCLPNFANEGVEKYELPSHGPVRNGLWRVIRKETNSLEIGFDFKNVGTYPGWIEVCQRYSLKKDCFSQKVKVVNRGERVPLNVAIHNYFATKNGWKNLEINGEDVSQKVKTNDYVFLRGDNIISVPGQRRLELRVKGFGQAKLWVSEGDKEYVCIEPVRGAEGFLDHEMSVVEKGEVLDLYQEILAGNSN